jgi:acid stress-induced BolA-like protein IbaG/YrbA
MSRSFKRRGSIEFKQKLQRALESAIRAERVILHDDDGVIVYVISPDFRGRDSYSRQELIYDSLRAPDADLNLHELRQLIAVVAFTPEEFAVLGPELPDLTPLRS